MARGPLVLLLWISACLFLSFRASCFYLPGVAPQDFHKVCWVRIWFRLILFLFLFFVFPIDFRSWVFRSCVCVWLLGVDAFLDVRVVDKFGISLPFGFLLCVFDFSHGNACRLLNFFVSEDFGFGNLMGLVLTESAWSFELEMMFQGLTNEFAIIKL